MLTRDRYGHILPMNGVSASGYAYSLVQVLHEIHAAREVINLAEAIRASANAVRDTHERTADANASTYGLAMKLFEVAYGLGPRDFRGAQHPVVRLYAEKLRSLAGPNTPDGFEFARFGEAVTLVEAVVEGQVDPADVPDDGMWVGGGAYKHGRWVRNEEVRDE